MVRLSRGVPWTVVVTAAVAVNGCGLVTGVGDLVIGSVSGGPSVEAGPGEEVDGAVDGGSDAARDAYVDVGPVPDSVVFYLQSFPGDGGRVSAPGVVSVGSGAGRVIGCASSAAAKQFAPTPFAGGGTTVPNGPYRYANLTMRAFQLADEPRGRVVFLDTSTSIPRLFAADEGSDCATRPPVRIDPAGGLQGSEHALPRFSPDGTRVAYVDWNSSQNNVLRVVTVDVDGTDVRVVRSAPGLPANTSLYFAAPTWISNTELAWFERNSAAANPLPIRLQRGPDMEATIPAASPPTCNVLIEQLDVFTRDGATRAVVVETTQGWSLAAQAGPSTVWVRELAQPCTGGVRLTNETAKGTAARDVAVSPNGRLIAFAWNVATNAAARGLGSPAHVYLVDSSGGTNPVACSGVDPATDDFGPQWIAGNARVAWMHAPRNGDPESIYVADVLDGKCVNVRPLRADAAGSSRYLTAANAGLTCGLGAGSAGASGSGTGSSTVLAIVAALSAARRRRRATHR